MLTLCMLLKNEARNLPAALYSIQSLNPELILIDTGSTDNTAQIAAAHNTKLLPFHFNPVHFAAARNYALDQATQPWILVLDADETLDPESLPLLQSILTTNQNAGYFLERHNHSIDRAAETIDHVVRLFPNNPAYRYQGRVHETIDASILRADGKLLTSKIRLHHNHSSDPAARRRKNHWYIEILKEEILADPTDTSRLDFLAAEYHQLEMYNEATEIAEQIAKLRPNDARAHLFAGTYHLLFQPNFRQARADFHKALELKPNYPEAESFLRLLDERENAASPQPAIHSEKQ